MSVARTVFTQLLAAFAEEEKIGLRRARSLRKAVDPRWVSFANRRAAQATQEGIVNTALAKLPEATGTPVDLANIDAALASVIKSQELAHAHLMRRLAIGDDNLIASALRNSREAADIRFKVEKLAIDQKKALGALVPIDDVHAILNRTLAPIVAALDGFAASHAVRCNPSSPLLAERALLDGVGILKGQVRSALAQLDKPTEK